MFDSESNFSQNHDSPTAHPERVNNHNYEILNSAQLRAEYVQLTDALIGEMVRQDTDTAIFLDKSARPVAWMVDELWDILAPHDEDGKSLMQRPTFKFLNIDREQWGAVIGRSEDKEGGVDLSRMPIDRLKELKELFAPVIGHSNEDDKSLLSDKRVLVIDEVRVSGDTGLMAEKILLKAFPDAEEIKKAYWMGGKVKAQGRSGVRINTKLPVWYSDRESVGRLVGDRDTSKSMRSNSSRQQIGRYWLSSPFREPDQKGLKLKKEIKWLAQDIKDHNLLYMPAPSWPAQSESIPTRIKRIDGFELDQYIEIKNELERHRTVGQVALIEKIYTNNDIIKS